MLVLNQPTQTRQNSTADYTTDFNKERRFLPGRLGRSEDANTQKQITNLFLTTCLVNKQSKNSSNQGVAHEIQKADVAVCN